LGRGRKKREFEFLVYVFREKNQRVAKNSRSGRWRRGRVVQLAKRQRKKPKHSSPNRRGEGVAYALTGGYKRNC